MERAYEVTRVALSIFAARNRVASERLFRLIWNRWTPKGHLMMGPVIVFAMCAMNRRRGAN